MEHIFKKSFSIRDKDSYSKLIDKIGTLEDLDSYNKSEIPNWFDRVLSFNIVAFLYNGKNKEKNYAISLRMIDREQKGDYLGEISVRSWNERTFEKLRDSIKNIFETGGNDWSFTEGLREAHDKLKLLLEKYSETDKRDK